MWLFKRKKNPETPDVSTPAPKPAIPPHPKPPTEPRDCAIVILEKNAGSGTKANLRDVLLELHLERHEESQFYSLEPPFTLVSGLTRSFAQKGVERLALAGVRAEVERMTAAPEIADFSAETGNHSVILVEAGHNKIAVIKVIRKATQYGLKEAKDLAEATPTPILVGVSETFAQSIAAELQQAGASVAVDDGSGNLQAVSGVVAANLVGYTNPTTTALPPGEWQLILVEAGKNKINVIKVIRQHTTLGLKEAKDLADAPSSFLLQGVDENTALNFGADLEDAGATVAVGKIGEAVQNIGVSVSKSSPSSLQGASLMASGWQVVLLDSGRNKIVVIKAIREATQLGLAEAKDLADKPPSVIASGLDEATAHAIARELQAAGATAQVSQN